MYSSGTQGGQSLLNPSYNKQISNYNFAATDGTSFEFDRKIGPQVLFFQDQTTGSTWSFGIKGGSNTTSFQGIPSYPYTSQVYDTSINYVIDPSYIKTDCTVTTQAIPSNTTRINVFRVVSPLPAEIEISLSPFANIPNKITFITIGNTTVNLKVITYRTPPNPRSSGTLSSFGAPQYEWKYLPTTFTSVLGVNPLDDHLPHDLPVYRGIQEITLLNTSTNYKFSFEVDCGVIGQGNGYIGYNFNPTQNPVKIFNTFNCTVTTGGTVPPNVVRNQVFNVSSTDGKNYQFEFKTAGETPTITLLAPGAFGANNVTVTISYRDFRTV